MSSCSQMKNKDYNLPKLCPKENCKIIADSLSEIEEKFGCRKMETGKIIPQSWCRDCRKEGLKNK